MAAPAPKAKRISASKQEQLVTAMRVQQEQKHNKEMLDWIVNELKKRPEMLMPVKACLESKSSGSAKTFPRQVKYITGPQTQSVPWYVLKDVLAQVTGATVGEVEMMAGPSKEPAKWLIMYGIGIPDKHPMPERRSTVLEFIE
eukprot:11196054-Lingulodinium_polyedra.AAC.1